MPVERARPMKLLGLCGSLRARSFSAGLLRAARALAPAEVAFELFEREGELPLFNPDLESRPARAVAALWRAVTDTDAIVIVSPEYAHGVTGSIKNALDWLVGHPPFGCKPVAAFNPAFQSVTYTRPSVVTRISAAFAASATLGRGSISFLGAGGTQ